MSQAPAAPLPSRAGSNAVLSGSSRRPPGRNARHALLFLLCVLPAACDGRAAPSTPKPQKLVVFAAASLRDAFQALAPDFERAHQGVRVAFEFAGTQQLRTQLEHGAQADVFASANPQHMTALARSHKVGPAVVFARNRPVIVVAQNAAPQLHDLAGLPALQRIVIGAAEVPIGRYTRTLLDRASASLGPDFRARVEAKVVSHELNVRQVLAKVVLGEAQAGIVYRSDAHAARVPLRVVPIPDAVNVVARYPVAVVMGAAHPTLAQAFIAWLLSPRGQSVLERAGFSAPAREHTADDDRRASAVLP